MGILPMHFGWTLASPDGPFALTALTALTAFACLASVSKRSLVLPCTPFPSKALAGCPCYHESRSRD